MALLGRQWISGPRQMPSDDTYLPILVNCSCCKSPRGFVTFVDYTYIENKQDLLELKQKVIKDFLPCGMD